MEDPNGLALDLVDEAIDFADELRVRVHRPDDDAAVVDFGVEAAGGIEAGLLLAEVASGGLTTVGTRLDTLDGVGLTHVALSTDHPELALLGCQSPRWSLELDGAEVRAAGPAQLRRDQPAGAVSTVPEPAAGFAIVVLEADRLPGRELTEAVAAAADVASSAVFVLVAPADSLAGSVAASARVAERALTRLVATGYDAAGVRSVSASAPVAPLAPRIAEARARSMAAIAGGGRVHLVLETDVEDPPRLAGPAPGDDVAPAQVTADVVDGPVHVVGSVDEGQLAADLGL